MDPWIHCLTTVSLLVWCQVHNSTGPFLVLHPGAARERHYAVEQHVRPHSSTIHRLVAINPADLIPLLRHLLEKQEDIVSLTRSRATSICCRQYRQVWTS